MMGENRQRLDQSYLDRLQAKLPDYFQPIDFSVGNLTSQQLRRHFIAHHNADLFFADLKNGQKGIVTLGFGVTGTPHLGTLMQMTAAIEFQRAGIPVQVVMGDADAFLGRSKDGSQADVLKQARMGALRFKTFFEKLGFNNSFPSTARSQRDRDVANTATFVHKAAEAEMYKIIDDQPGRADHVKNSQSRGIKSSLKQAQVRLMAADFLYYAHKKCMPLVTVMSGIDEYPFLNFTESVLTALQGQGVIDPTARISGLFTALLPGLWSEEQGKYYDKMSKSEPMSGVTLDLTEEQIIERVTEGEGPSRDKNMNPVYQMVTATLPRSSEELSKIDEAFLEHGEAWHEVKMNYAYQLMSIFNLWKEIA